MYEQLINVYSVMVLWLEYLQKYLQILLNMEAEEGRNLSCVEVK